MGTHLRVLIESFLTNTQGQDGFQNYLHSCAMDESRHSIGRVKTTSCLEFVNNFSNPSSKIIGMDILSY